MKAKMGVNSLGIPEGQEITVQLGPVDLDPRDEVSNQGYARIQCRFNAETIRGAPLTETNGDTRSYQYRCKRCSQYHWCIPSFEADGTAATHEEAVQQIMDALDRFWLLSTGTTWRQVRPEDAADPSRLIKPWQPPDGTNLPVEKEND